MSAAIAQKSELLSSHGFSHGFFGRTGGVSPAPWESLNFSAASGDSLEHIAQNLALAGELLGVAAERICFLSQVHGVEVVELDGSEDRTQLVMRQGDATLSRAAGVACAVRSADCGTLLFGDTKSGMVCAVHAGWRGVAQNIIAASVQALVSRGANTQDLVVAIGPHIERCCFEVGSEVAAELAACSSASDVVLGGKPKPHVDLRKIMTAQLRDIGVTAVDHVAGCTVCQPAKYFSYRNEGQISGRLLSAIVVRP